MEIIFDVEGVKVVASFKGDYWYSICRKFGVGSGDCPTLMDSIETTMSYLSEHATEMINMDGKMTNILQKQKLFFQNNPNFVEKLNLAITEQLLFLKKQFDIS